ncbi:hypothetical protein Taro_054953, partial [Colocasia esculenta]|nr:hypothetical protein [Colocasia esculenta]
MSKQPANSSPDLPVTSITRHVDDSSILEGATAKVRLLLKLVQDYEDAARNGGGGASARRPPHSIAGILCVLDDVKSGLERSHASTRRREAELCRCNTDLRRGSVTGVCPSGVLYGSREHQHRRPPEVAVEENQRLRKQVSASLAAQKSLEKMFSSLGKEKEIMAAELQRKAHKLRDLEEHLDDLKAQNEMLMHKLQLCAEEHRVGKAGGGSEEAAEAAACSERMLSEQLLRELEGCRSLKRRLIEVQEEKVGLQARMADMAGQVAVRLDRIREFCRGVV